ncbi:MAG: glycosyltransferase family 2 protein [Patescibacteria group bacterium]
MDENFKKQVSVIIPVFNEQETVSDVIKNIKLELHKLNLTYEIIAVNDCSTDNTKNILQNIENIKIINHSYNKGNGAALKTGARTAQYDWILTFDADGQHNPEYIAEMLKYTDDYDLISGERVGYKGPWIRQPGKKIIHWLARYLLGHKINDFNCGLRLVKRNEFLRFAHLYPDGFSCCTTSIFAFLKEKLNIKFIPIKINKRENGKSQVSTKDAFTYLMLIIRLIMLFSPLRIFLPISFLFFLLFIFLFINDMLISEFNNISDSTVLLFISSVLIFFFGLIADQLAAIRRELNKK